MAAPPATLMFVLSRWGLGGMERVTCEVARHLDPARYRPVLCYLKPPLRQGGDPAGVHGAPYLTHKYDLRVLGRVRGLMGRERPQAVFALGSGDAAFWGRLAARLSGVRGVAWWVHSMRDNIGRLNRALLPWTDVVIALSPKHRDYLIRRCHMPARKVTVVPNGIDWEAFQLHEQRAQVREELGLGPQAWVVGSVGGLRPVKGYEVLLRAVSAWLPHHPHGRAVIVGDGEQRPQLDSLARELGVGNHVAFLGARQDVPRLLPAFDVFALSSHSEAFPLSVLEAMASGLPVVATDVGCLSEIVPPAEAGVLVPPGDPEQFARALKALAQRPDEARKTGNRGSEFVRLHWPLSRAVAEFQSLVDRLTS